MNRCSKCKKELPSRSFCKIKGKLSRICLKCDRKRHEEDYLKNFNKAVMQLYDGRCVMCDGVENLEIIPTMKTRRRNIKAMVLICSNCKRKGVPTMSRYLRDCMRCGHRWVAMKPTTIQCPKCGSSYWHMPKRG